MSANPFAALDRLYYMSPIAQVINAKLGGFAYKSPAAKVHDVMPDSIIHTEHKVPDHAPQANLTPTLMALGKSTEMEMPSEEEEEEDIVCNSPAPKKKISFRALKNQVGRAVSSKNVGVIGNEGDETVEVATRDEPKELSDVDSSRDGSCDEPSHVESCRDDKPSNVESCRDDKPSNVESCRDDKPSNVESCRDDKPSNVESCRDDKPSNVESSRDYEPGSELQLVNKSENGDGEEQSLRRAGQKRKKGQTKIVEKKTLALESDQFGKDRLRSRRLAQVSVPLDSDDTCSQGTEEEYTGDMPSAPPPVRQRRSRKRKKKGRDNEKIKDQDDSPSKNKGEKDPVVMDQWALKPSAKGICLEGHRLCDPEDVYWLSTAIKDRISAHLVATASGQQYKLMGPMAEEQSREMGVSARLCSVFSHGFPISWKEEFSRDQELHMPVGVKGMKVSDSLDAKPVPRKRKVHRMNKRTNKKKILEVTDLPVTRSGRLVKPQLAWWANQRVVVHENSNTILYEPGTPSVDVLDSAIPKFREDKHALERARQTDAELVAQMKLNISRNKSRMDVSGASAPESDVSISETDKQEHLSKTKEIASSKHVDVSVKAKGTRDSTDAACNPDTPDKTSRTLASSQATSKQRGSLENLNTPKPADSREEYSRKLGETLSSIDSSSERAWHGKQTSFEPGTASENQLVSVRNSSGIEQASTPISRHSMGHRHREGKLVQPDDINLLNYNLEKEVMTVIKHRQVARLKPQKNACYNTLQGSSPKTLRDMRLKNGHTAGSKLIKKTRELKRRPSEFEPDVLTGASDTEVDSQKSPKPLSESQLEAYFSQDVDDDVLSLDLPLDKQDDVNNESERSVVAAPSKVDTRNLHQRVPHTQEEEHSDNHCSEPKQTKETKTAMANTLTGIKSRPRQPCRDEIKSRPRRSCRNKQHLSSYLIRDDSETDLNSESDSDAPHIRRSRRTKSSLMHQRSELSHADQEYIPDLPTHKEKSGHAKRIRHKATDLNSESDSGSPHIRRSTRTRNSLKHQRSESSLSDKEYIPDLPAHKEKSGHAKRIRHKATDLNSDSDSDAPHIRRSTRTRNSLKHQRSESSLSDQEYIPDLPAHKGKSGHSKKSIKHRTSDLNSEGKDNKSKGSTRNDVQSKKARSRQRKHQDNNHVKDNGPMHEPEARSWVLPDKPGRERTQNGRLSQAHKGKENIDAKEPENLFQLMTGVQRRGILPTLEEEPDMETQPWREKEIHRFRVAMSQVDPTDYNMWEKVAATVKTRTAQECKEYHYQPSAKTTKKVKPKVHKQKVANPSQLTAGLGTMKRKQQLRELVENHNQGYNDDFFDSTPFKKKAALKVPNMENSLDELFPGSQHGYRTPGNFSVATPIVRHAWMPTSEKKTPHSSALTPGLLKSVDRTAMDGYIHQMMRRRHGRARLEGARKSIPLPAQKSKPSTDISSASLFDSKPESDQDMDSEEEQDYYFSGEEL